MEGIASTHTDEKSIQFHVKCFDVWDAERLRALPADRHFRRLLSLIWGTRSRLWRVRYSSCHVRSRAPITT
jgi:hypothetical protein